MMHDLDSEPISGYFGINRMVVNLESVDLPENTSIKMAEQMIQGTNAFGTVGYGGPTPQDKPHTCQIFAYALDTMPELQNGFTEEEFFDAADDHLLVEAEMTFEYPKL
ncbi:MAG TPA: hypothetical protein GXZ43_05305 [Clostridiaceae bacterium]|nr:hypothetical protein [Clostridiaceae bacterium]